MKIKKQLVKRSIAGDLILVPIGDASLELKGLLTLNETAERIWDLLPQCVDEAALTAAMLEEYDVSEDVLKADINELLDRLRELQII